MSHQQDPAAASAPFDSRPAANSNGSLAQGKPSDHAQRAPDSNASRAQDQPSDEARTIEVVAKRFSFEPSRIEVTEGERVRLIIKSADGVHGVEIKKFKVNKKIPRGGDLVTIEFTASAAGKFPILCSEYCGEGHDDMKGMLVVVAK